MIATNNVAVRFGGRTLYENVNLKFSDGNCYGLIGANGAGKSTFLRVLSGELEPNDGNVVMNPNETLFTLKQDHFAYDDKTVLETVMMGNAKLFEIMHEKDALYAKEDFNEEDGIKAGELEGIFAELDGWNAESNAATLLNGLGIDTELHDKLMSELSGDIKVKVLLCQALFGNPDTLLLDEPTNHLDLAAIAWLERFLINYDKTVIVVSHDRHFLNKVCTHIADVDFGKIKIFSGNYDFWYESSQLISKQLKDANKKKEEKMKELEDFIARFAANASKSKQATSRKKTLDKISLDDIQPSTRKYPYIEFKPEKESGKSILFVENLSKTVDDVKLINNVSFNIMKGDKIALIGDPIATTLLLRLIIGEVEPDEGTIQLGQTIVTSYAPNDNQKYFTGEESICEWLSNYSNVDDMSYIRGFLGRMLFSGEEALKQVNVLSGGEKARCMLSKSMLEAPNLLLLDDPTNHLDLESITALNNSLTSYKSELIFVSHDHQFISTIANRIIEITEDGIIDRRMNYDDYLLNVYGID
ncbi:MAG: ATP-binding cassette domain-containing protein [Erysipelotrichaceae bacterium]